MAEREEMRAEREEIRVWQARGYLCVARESGGIRARVCRARGYLGVPRARMSGCAAREDIWVCRARDMTLWGNVDFRPHAVSPLLHACGGGLISPCAYTRGLPYLVVNEREL